MHSKYIIYVRVDRQGRFSCLVVRETAGRSRTCTFIYSPREWSEVDSDDFDGGRAICRFFFPLVVRGAGLVSSPGSGRTIGDYFFDIARQPAGRVLVQYGASSVSMRLHPASGTAQKRAYWCVWYICALCLVVCVCVSVSVRVCVCLCAGGWVRAYTDIYFYSALRLGSQRSYLGPSLYLPYLDLRDSYLPTLHT